MIIATFMPPAWLFWVCLAVLIYTYIGYPALCWLRSRIQPKPWRASADFLPRVSVVVAAYNEELYIESRIRDIAEQHTDFPFEVLVGSDGSSDQTVDIARRAALDVAATGVTVRVFDLPRRGKAATLATLIHEADGDVIVFTDANCRFAAGALSAVVAPLADPRIGCADGVKRIDSGNLETAAGERSYWSFETRLKRWEGTFASCAGADGALYAVRKADLPMLPTSRLIADDFLISLGPCLRGLRCVLVPDAVAIEPSETTKRSELRRKARILAGALAVIATYPTLLLPGSGVSLALWSHKIFRWFTFVPLCCMLLAAVALPTPEALAFYTMTCLAFAAVAIGAAFPGALRAAPVKLAYYFALMNFGQVLGLIEWMRNGNQPAWEKAR